MIIMTTMQVFVKFILKNSNKLEDVELETKYISNYRKVLFLSYIFVGLCTHVQVPARGSHKRLSDPLELVLQEVGSHVIWFLETKLRSSVRLLCSLNH